MMDKSHDGHACVDEKRRPCDGVNLFLESAGCYKSYSASPAMAGTECRSAGTVSAERKMRARWEKQMIIKNVSLETVCGITSKLPQNTRPEVAFAGKSNVGKSSLINALMNRKSLARTSAQPGKTQTINYYNINDAIYFVDLPGYGYAKTSESVRAQWGKMIENYLHKSKQLRRVFLLIDIRHAPSENDRIMYKWICDSGYQPVVIATKLDKINRSQIQKQMKLIRTGLDAAPDTVILPFSAQTKQGRDEIYEILDCILEE